MPSANVIALEQPLEHRDGETRSLDDVFKSVWEDLMRGAERRAHPFHLGVLATSGGAGSSLRTVVLRDVSREQRALMCHTDRRSEKLTEVREDDRVAWLFYDAESKVQLRLSGTAAVHIDDEVAKLRWKRTNVPARRCYLTTHAPGEALPCPGAQLPAHLNKWAPKVAESEDGFPHFAVIARQIVHIDWLRLTAGGHERAQFSWAGNDWQSKLGSALANR
jgi:pyridoxine/pyridoxamine 5'-phosphate oxidase